MRHLKKKNLDFISASRRSPLSLSILFSRQAVLLLLPALLVCTGFGVFGSYMWKGAYAKRETEQILKNMESTEEYKEEADYRYYRFMVELEKAGKMIESIPEMSSDGLASIYHTTGTSVTIETIEYEDGSFKIVANTPDYKEASAYARGLKDAGTFERIQYNGFSLEQAEYGPVYRFSVTAITGEGGTP